MNILKLALVSIATAGSLLAHGFWLNSFEAKSHGSSLVTVGFGTGHNLTIEDSISDRLSLESFNLLTPDGEKIQLKKPLKGLDDIYDSDTINIVDSNLAMQKISLNKKSKAGTYSVEMSTKTNIFTKYIDKNGKNRFFRGSAEKVKNPKKIISSLKNTIYAKTYFVNKKWSEPKPVGHKLELIPITDISKLYVGDKIKFKVLFKGKPLNSGFVTATNSLSKGDNALFSNIRKGVASFVLTNFGQWKFEINNKSKEDDLVVSDTASATLNIK
ncbi:DUF4198 domain-containing protein [Halarcobacter sp.]|uniref:DUF4198 domain-containing protein n=1 Tax=Halarcobacter sp. TaxID=2321133 RepID=UPI002AA92F3E|nr:DUF4198 domain-containing protein [Halarcobacter sp.]